MTVAKRPQIRKEGHKIVDRSFASKDCAFIKSDKQISFCQYDANVSVNPYAIFFSTHVYNTQIEKYFGSSLYSK